MKANTSKRKAISYKRMKEKEERLEREIEEPMYQAEEADWLRTRYVERMLASYNLPEELQQREERSVKNYAERISFSP